MTDPHELTTISVTLRRLVVEQTDELAYATGTTRERLSDPMNAAKAIRKRLEDFEDERENFLEYVGDTRVSARTMAKAAGVASRTWRRWEAGENAMPTHTINHMRRVLHGLEEKPD